MAPEPRQSLAPCVSKALVHLPDTQDSPKVVLVVALSPRAKLTCAELQEPPTEEFRGPAELLVRAIPEPEHGEGKIFE